MTFHNKSAYHYSDISLIPRSGVLASRSEADVSVKFGNRTFMLPLVPANMKCTVNEELALMLAQNGYFYIIHRFDIDVISFIRLMNKLGLYSSISVGVKTADYEILKKIKSENLSIDYITIDIAHGHSSVMFDMIKFIKDNFDSFIIAGNIATPDAAIDLKKHGADAIKVGIGQGGACTTKDKTGFTLPMFSCVKNVCRQDLGLPIIADGGIKNNGDIAKAIAAGADFVMAGSIFAECSDSPSETFIDEKNNKYKLYYGSASKHNKCDSKHIEGTLRYVPQNAYNYLEKLEEVRHDLSSAVSYSGGSSLADLKVVDFCVSR